MTVFVATDETSVLGVYSTKEKAQAAADEWSQAAIEKRGWHRYDGAWQQSYRLSDSGWLVLRVTEAEIDA